MRQQLSDLMTTWQQLRAASDLLEDQIKAEVLRLQRSQSFGNVRAIYSSGPGDPTVSVKLIKEEPQEQLIVEYDSDIPF